MYKFSIEKVNSLVDRKEELFNKLNNINTRNKFELQLLNSLSTIVSKTSDLSSSIFALHHLEI